MLDSELDIFKGCKHLIISLIRNVKQEFTFMWSRTLHLCKSEIYIYVKREFVLFINFLFISITNFINSFRWNFFLFSFYITLKQNSLIDCNILFLWNIILIHSPYLIYSFDEKKINFNILQQILSYWILVAEGAVYYLYFQD